MVDDDATGERGREIFEALTPEEREELERRRYVRTGSHLVWIEPESGVRRERLSNLYYVRTDRGVFRVSRISGEIVEV